MRVRSEQPARFQRGDCARCTRSNPQMCRMHAGSWHKDLHTWARFTPSFAGTVRVDERSLGRHRRALISSGQALLRTFLRNDRHPRTLASNGPLRPSQQPAQPHDPSPADNCCARPWCFRTKIRISCGRSCPCAHRPYASLRRRLARHCCRRVRWNGQVPPEPSRRRPATWSKRCAPQRRCGGSVGRSTATTESYNKGAARAGARHLPG